MILNGSKGAEASLDGSITIVAIAFPEGWKTESFLIATLSFARPSEVLCDAVI